MSVVKREKRASRSGRSVSRRPNRASLRRGKTRDQVKQVLYQAFRQRFPEDTVDISDGYQDNIHVMVVSRQFDDLTEAQKQDLMWGILDASELSPAEKRLVSLLYPVSPAEIK